jgi:phosphinothricin acetyltransferase
MFCTAPARSRKFRRRSKKSPSGSRRSQAPAGPGFGYYAQYRARSAYRFAAEDSVYVRENIRGQGVGKAIVAALLTHAAGQKFTEMLAVIGDSENVGSIGVHASLGFIPAGTMRRVGFKFGRWLDVVTMQKSLT